MRTRFFDTLHVSKHDAGAGNDTLDGGMGEDNLYGGIGNDVYYVDNENDVVAEYIDEGTDTVFSSANYTLDDGSPREVENLILTGTLSINATGNYLNNTLTGNSGNNSLDGGLGADKLIGGSGNDTFIVDNALDVVTDSSGIDLVLSSVSFTLGTGLENLTLTGTGDINGTGNSSINILLGNDGANRLDGGSGNDKMSGGLGDDTYLVGATGDIINELFDEGNDTVLSTVSYTLAGNLENLTLTGTSGLSATGNEIFNTLTGNAGANILDGKAGADTMIGGLGKDTYIVDDLGDTVEETSTLPTEIDTVKSAVDYTLGSNLEILILTAPGHTGIGNTLNNTLTGSSGDDTLDGSLGADKMSGGTGNDVYYVDNIADGVTESSSTGGIDTVYSSVDFTLGSNVENLNLLGSALKGTGSSGANIINGNNQENTLNGMSGNDVLDGGASHDILTGGTGNDTFAFKAASFDGSSDTITDFNSALDFLDVSDLLVGYDPLTSLLNDFVEFIVNGANTSVNIDRDGQGLTYSLGEIASLTNVALTDETSLVATGHLIVA